MNGMIDLGAGSRLYTVRDWIRDLGGKFDSARRVWMVPADRADEAKKIIGDISIGHKPVKLKAAQIHESIPEFVPMDYEEEKLALLPQMSPDLRAEGPKNSAPQLGNLPFKPTAEQLALIEAFGSTAGDLIAPAFAGAGKTSTLILLAHAFPRVRFLYLCFNKKNADEARKKVPGNVEAMTAHSLAFQHLRVGEHPQKLSMVKYDFAALFKRVFQGLGDPILVPGINEKQYVDLLRESIKYFESSTDEKVRIKPDGRTVKLVSAAFILSMKGIDGLKAEADVVVEKYADRHPSIRDRYPELIATLDTIGRDHRRNVLSTIRSLDPTALAVMVNHYQSAMLRDHLPQFISQLEDHAERFRKIQTDLDSSVPFEHSTYLKMYQLSRPVIRGFDVILYDEGQDANPVMLDIVRRQTMRRVWVGDQHQSINEFTGAVNTIEDLIKEGIPALPLTRSFRFGPNVADLANRVLSLKYRYFPSKFPSGSIPEIIGAGSGTADGNVAILCRSNVGVLQEALANRSRDIYFADCLPYTYLMAMIDIYRLKMELPIINKDSQYFGYSSVEELKHEADLRGDVDTMRAIGLLEKMGPEDFKEAVDSLIEIAKTAKKTAKIHILTAHKAKGLEWANVQLSSDFVSRFVEKDGGMRKEVPEQEINLLYVAVTRARQSVSLPSELKELIASGNQQL